MSDTQKHAALLEAYRGIPERIQAAIAGLGAADLDLARAPGAWTIRQIVLHLADSDMLGTVLMRAALGNSGCTFDLGWYTPDNRWADTLEYARRPVEPALALIAANQATVQEILERFASSWERHLLLKRDATREPVRISIAQLLELHVDHLSHHIGQIRATREMHGR